MYAHIMQTSEVNDTSQRYSMYSDLVSLKCSVITKFKRRWNVLFYYKHIHILAQLQT